MVDWKTNEKWTTVHIVLLDISIILFMCIIKLNRVNFERHFIILTFDFCTLFPSSHFFRFHFFLHFVLVHSYSCFFFSFFFLLSLHCNVHRLVHPSKLNKYNLVISASAPYTTLVIYVLGYFLDRSNEWYDDYMNPPHCMDERFLWLFPDIISPIMYVYMHIILNHCFLCRVGHFFIFSSSQTAGCSYAF